MRKSDTNASSTQVTIIDSWNGARPKINALFYQFYIYLADHKIKEIIRDEKKYARNQCGYNESENNRPILWMEKLLQMSIQDHRKFVAPYLMNVRKLSYKESFDTITQWLHKCNEFKRLDFNIDQKIKEGLRGAAKGYYPISLTRLKDELPELYNYFQSL